MAEIAVTDGRPLPGGLPRGDCILTRLDDGTIHVDHADPRILISSELLDATIGVPNGLLRLPVRLLDMTGCRPGGYVGAVLHIHGINRQVVYRITDYAPRVHGYIAEWPD